MNPGAISTVSPNAVITNSVFSRNRAAAVSTKGTAIVYGGAIGNSGTLALRRSTVTNNVATARGTSTIVRGAGVFSGRAPFADLPVRLTMAQNVVARNRPDQCYGC